jgi:hypothetical protein
MTDLEKKFETATKDAQTLEASVRRRHTAAVRDVQAGDDW